LLPQPFLVEREFVPFAIGYEAGGAVRKDFNFNPVYFRCDRLGYEKKGEGRLGTPGRLRG